MQQFTRTQAVGHGVEDQILDKLNNKYLSKAIQVIECFFFFFKGQVTPTPNIIFNISKICLKPYFHLVSQGDVMDIHYLQGIVGWLLIVGQKDVL